ncbi:neural cell adhesion molecule 1-like [Acropora muricata]|uniref:neural cell adhesion molecule 1-like n=1 Tax=Acropora muricata TaxID=159855 RepID=UPI0034E52F48
MGTLKSYTFLGVTWSCCIYFFSIELIPILSAQLVNWSQTPNNPTIGIAGENVTLKWKYSLNLVAGDTFDFFVIRRFAPSKFDFDEIVKYGIDGTVVVYNRFKGRFTLRKSATPELLLIKAKDTDETRYCCKVYSKNDNAQNCVLLKILVRPNITSISSDQTSNETDDLKLSCHATGTPSPSIAWSRQGNKEWRETNSPLLLKNISRYQDGEYVCTAMNDAGNSTASVMVTVNYPPSIFPAAKGYNFTEGYDIKLECRSDGRPSPTVTWRKNGGYPLIKFKAGERLVIVNASRSDAGDYLCTAENGIGNVQASAEINVNVFFAPSIDSEVLNQTLNETQDMRMVCTASGNPQPVITWSRAPSSKSLSSIDGVLTARNVSKTDSGVYQCRASNEIGNDAIVTFSLGVNYKPTETKLTYESKNQFVVVEDTVIFACSADSFPPSKLELGFNNKILGYFYNGRFSLHRVNTSNEGVYECIARNMLGTGVSPRVSLTVYVSPTIDYISQNATVNETEDVTLFCNASGKPTPSVTWSYLGNTVEMSPVKNKTLLLRKASRGQTGRFRCTAQNGAGNTAVVYVNVAVNYKPEMKNKPFKAVRSWINHHTLITCKAQGFPVPEITWSRKGNVESSTEFQTRDSTLSFTPREAGDFGAYVCTARNLLGIAKEEFVIQELYAPEAPEIQRIDVDRKNNMEIHWKVMATFQYSPILDYLVQIRKKREPNQWMNCTKITVREGSMMCVMNNLEAKMIYIVRMSARNVVGYGNFTVREVLTKEDQGGKEERRKVPRSLITWIIVGIIIGLAVLFITVVIVIYKYKRRSRSRAGGTSQNKGSQKVTQMLAMIDTKLPNSVPEIIKLGDDTQPLQENTES